MKHKVEWFCETCATDEVPYTTAQFKAHLKEVHQVEEFKGSQKLEQALEGDNYINTYSVTIGPVKAVKVTSGPK